jgi:acetyl-CoA synthetase
VREAAAVASPDELRGNVVKAFIVLAADHEPSDELADEIKAFVRERLSAYAYPRRIEFVDDLPKTLTGKTAASSSAGWSSSARAPCAADAGAPVDGRR